MNILITGGAGFIGSNFIRYFLNEHPEYSVINLDKLTYAGNLANLSDIQNLPNYTFIKGDICDRNLVDSLEFGAVINFAAESHVDKSILDPYPFLQTNVIGTQSLLDIVKKRACRMLHVSTDEVYGSIEKGLFTEKSPLSPNSPYAASKASSDMLVRAYHETFGLDLVITRCSNNYGSFQFPEKLIPLVIINALQKKQIPVYGDGGNIRDWLHVIDHCRAIDLAFHEAHAGDIYNIGAKNEQKNINIINILLKLVAKKTGINNNELSKLITYVKDRPGHDRRYAIDPSKIENDIGWRPSVNFEEGLSETIDWYLSNRLWWERIISGDYMDYYRAQYSERFEK